MIPVALPSVEALLLLAFLLVMTCGWVVWTLSLLVRYAAGRWKRPMVLPYGLVTAVALFTLWQIGDFYLQMNAYENERAASYRPELSAPARLGKIDMPKGTKLELAIADNREAFSQAVFPHPVRIADVDALDIARYIAIKTNENYETVGFAPESMRVTGIGVAIQSAWRCDATQPVEFDLKPDGDISAFTRCVLADGNVVDGISLPKGTSVRSSTGNVYIDGFVDRDRWVVDAPEGQVVHIDDFALEDVTLAFDEGRKLYEIRSAKLSEEKSVGMDRFPPGTEINLNSRQIRGEYPGAWSLRPSAGLTAPEAGRSMVLSRDGKVLSIRPD